MTSPITSASRYGPLKFRLLSNFQQPQTYAYMYMYIHVCTYCVLCSREFGRTHTISSSLVQPGSTGQEEEEEEGEGRERGEDLAMKDEQLLLSLETSVRSEERRVGKEC